MSDSVLVIIQQLFFMLLFLFFMFYTLKYKGDKSLHITLTVVLLGQFFMLAIEQWLWKVSHKETLKFAWFNVFAWCDITIVYAIYKLHQRDHFALSFAARNAIYSHIALTACQFIGYFERAFFNTGLIADAYIFLVPTISNAMLAVLTYAVGKDIFQAVSAKRSRRHA